MARDSQNAAKVAILNEFAARTYFANTNPIGKRIGMGLDGPADIEVVGVVKDMKYRGLRSPTERVVYTPLAQDASTGISVEVRTQGEPLAVAGMVRTAVGKLIRHRPIERFQTMKITVDNQLMPERLMATLSGFFGVLAALLAAIGLYGVTAYAVARRTGEIGLRMALGARQSDVEWQVMRETMALVAAGAVAGVGGALPASRVAVSLLYGVSAADPVAISGALAVLGATAFLAGWIPARRASRVDPMTALRQE